MYRHEKTYSANALKRIPVPIEDIRKLQFFIKEGQNTAITEPSDPKRQGALWHSLEEMLSAHPCVYVDFNDVNTICDLTEKIIEECRKMFSVYGIDMNITEADCSDDYHGLNKALKILQETAERLGADVFFVLRNYTYVLKIDEGERIQAHMRSVLQHQDNVVCIFTGRDKQQLNKIFMNPAAPFFRFVRIVGLR